MRLAHASLLIALTLGTGGLVTACLNGDQGQDFEEYPVEPGNGASSHGGAQVGQPGDMPADGGEGSGSGSGGGGGDGGIGPDGFGNVGDANIGQDSGVDMGGDAAGTPGTPP